MACKKQLTAGLPGFQGPPGPPGPQGPPGPSDPNAIGLPVLSLQVELEYDGDPAPGHQFTSIQDAIDYATSLPFVYQYIAIHIGPGIFNENITVAEHIILSGTGTSIQGSVIGTNLLSAKLKGLNILGALLFTNGVASLYLDDINLVGNIQLTGFQTIDARNCIFSSSTGLYPNLIQPLSGGSAKFFNCDFIDHNPEGFQFIRTSTLQTCFIDSNLNIGNSSTATTVRSYSCTFDPVRTVSITSNGYGSFRNSNISNSKVTGAGTSEFDTVSKSLLVPDSPTPFTFATDFGITTNLSGTYLVIMAPTSTSLGYFVSISPTDVTLVSDVISTYLVTLLNINPP